MGISGSSCNFRTANNSRVKKYSVSLNDSKKD